MGDISELRGLLVVGTFLAIAILLIAFIPYQFYTAEATRTIEIPEYFDIEQAMGFTPVGLYTLNETGGDPIGDFYRIYLDGLGHTVELRYLQANKPNLRLQFTHEYGWLEFHAMSIRNAKGIQRTEISPTVLYATYIQKDYEDAQPYSIYCSHFSFTAYFGYNKTLYSSVENAWNNHALDLVIGKSIWDQQGTTINAWNIITGILFFKPISGIPSIVNTIIAIPLWIAIAYITFILILRAIGALFGGGA